MAKFKKGSLEIKVTPDKQPDSDMNQKKLTDFTTEQIQSELKRRLVEEKHNKLNTIPEDTIRYSILDDVVPGQFEGYCNYVVHLDDGSEGVDILVSVHWTHSLTEEQVIDHARHYALLQFPGEEIFDVSVEEVFPYSFHSIIIEEEK